MMTSLIHLGTCLLRSAGTLALYVLIIITGAPFSNLRAQGTAPKARTLPLPLGGQSAEPATAFFDRRADPASDRLPELQRLSKEISLSNSEKELKDPGLVVKGRDHDLSLRIVDYQEPFEAIPAQYATTIVVGTLLASHGFVSTDHTSVYTEHTFSLEQVLKADDSSLTPGTQVVGTRLGGTVHFVSGHVRDYATYGEGIPKAGRRYLFSCGAQRPPLP